MRELIGEWWMTPAETLEVLTTGTVPAWMYVCVAVYMGALGAVGGYATARRLAVRREEG